MTSIPIGPAVILAIFIALAFYFIGIFDNRLTEGARRKLQENSAQAAVEKEQGVVGEHTVLKVTVDPGLKWHLELDGTRLEDLSSINADQRQRLVNVVVQMRPWIDSKSGTPAPATPNPNPPVSVAAAPEPAVPAQPVTSLPPLKPTVAPIGTQPVADEAPKIDVMRGLRSLLSREVKSPDAMKGPSIVAMIDDVLQAKLLVSPLAGKGIRLEEGSMGEVIVFVGSNRYPGVDAVPDPDVQAIIKSAIADWEKR